MQATENNSGFCVKRKNCRVPLRAGGTWRVDGAVLEAGVERTAIRVDPEIQKLTLIECLWGVSPTNESVPKPRERFTCQ